MNINPINNFIGRNDNTNAVNYNKKNPAFKHATFDGELREIFATPKHALRFMNAFEKYKTTPLNLLKILDYDRRTGIYKMIIDEFLSYIKKKYGEGAVYDFPVTVKPKPVYYDDELWAYDTELYATFPVKGENYIPCNEGNNYISNYPFTSSYNGGHMHIDRFYTGKIHKHTYNDHVDCDFDPELHLCDIEAALDNALYKRFSDIYDVIVNKGKELPQEALDAVWNGLQSAITSDTPIFTEEGNTVITDTQFLTSAYEILNITNQQSYSTEFIIKSLFKKVGIDMEDKNCLSLRIKGQSNIGSIINKLLNGTRRSEALRRAIKCEKEQEVMETVYDMYGVRFKAKTPAEIDKFYGEFVNFIKSGTIIPTHIVNYHYTYSEPFFSKKQINELTKLTNELRLNTEFSDVCPESGYTGVNIRTKVVLEKGKEQPVEIQVCNQDTAFLIDILHYAYDVFSGKNLILQYDNKKRQILKPLVKELTHIKNDTTLRQRYNRYTGICYSIAREYSRNFPDISEWELPEIVSCQRAAEITEQLNDIKYG